MLAIAEDKKGQREKKYNTNKIQTWKHNIAVQYTRFKLLSVVPIRQILPATPE